MGFAVLAGRAKIEDVTFKVDEFAPQFLIFFMDADCCMKRLYQLLFSCEEGLFQRENGVSPGCALHQAQVVHDIDRQTSYSQQEWGRDSTGNVRCVDTRLREIVHNNSL